MQTKTPLKVFLQNFIFMGNPNFVRAHFYSLFIGMGIAERLSHGKVFNP